MIRRIVSLVAALVLAGCDIPDPLNIRLSPGRTAKIADETWAVLRTEAGPVELTPGTIVRATDDPGEYRQTEAEFMEVGAGGLLTPAESSAGPSVFPEGHEKARLRFVQVVVEGGKHKGLAGSMRRLYLSPVP